MSNMSRQNQGLTPGLKALLLFIGVLLAIIVYLVWAYIIRTGIEITTVEPQETQSEQATDGEGEETDDGTEAAYEAAKADLATYISTPACDAIDDEVNALVAFEAAGVARGGLTDDDKQIVADALNTINSNCPKDVSLGLAEKLVPTDATYIASAALNGDWITPERPAPEGARALENFSFDRNNFNCIFQSNQVACSVYYYEFAAQPSSCSGGYTQTVYTSAKTATETTCEWRVKGDTQAQDGDYAMNGFACSVRDNGKRVECWSELSGHGFELSRGELRTF